MYDPVYVFVHPHYLVSDVCLPAWGNMFTLNKEMNMFNERCMFFNKEMNICSKRDAFSLQGDEYVQREMHLLKQHISKCGCSVSNLLWPTYCIGAKTLLGTKTCFASPASHKCGSSSSSLSQLKEKVISFPFSWKWFYSNSHPYPFSVSVFVISQGKEKVIW